MPVIFSFVFAHQLGTLFHQLNWILMLEYKLTLPKYNINNRTEVCTKKEGFMRSVQNFFIFAETEITTFPP